MRQRASRAAGLLLLLLAGLAAFLLLRREAPELGTGDLAEERSREAAAPAEALAEGAPALEAGGSAVVRPGSVEGARAPRASVGEGDPEPSVPVDPKGPFQGVCVDEEDRPVAGATVLVVNGRAGGRGVDRGAFAPARSDADGRFEVPAPETVESVRVRASGAGRVAVRADEEMTRGRLTRIVLLRAVEVRVRVLEEGTGVAVRGARVSLLAGEENANRGDVDFALHPPTDEAATDETGRAVLLGPGGPCAVLAKARDRAPRLVSPLHVSTAGMDLTVVLERGQTLVGRVIGEDALPVVGARVHATARLGWRGEATTDADGAFRFEGLPPDFSHEVLPVGRELFSEEETVVTVVDQDPLALVLVVEADGYPVHAFERDPRSRSGRAWEVRLNRAAPVSGTLQAVAGAFPPGATVRLVPSLAIPEGLILPPLPRPQVVAPDGSFRFDDVRVLPVEVVVENADGDPL
ncbi:MAG TPA: carboxypeptidase-like regulatory domain-containing protein, partial [Planctomycetota bacterium]|nr:carboxypeptidase-like regulatory domain-containing protein [Planctomycetota bacterium]